MPDLRKVTIASIGVQTIGSLSLKEVLITTGTPVLAWKAEISSWKRGFDLRLTSCTRAVPSWCTMAGIWSRRSGLDARRKQHELVARRVLADLEPLVGMLGHHARRKRAKILAVLDLLIEDVAHLRPARIGEQRAVAERARAELHAALKPGDDLAVGDHLRGLARRRLALPRLEPGGLHRSQNLAPAEARARDRASRCRAAAASWPWRNARA